MKKACVRWLAMCMSCLIMILVVVPVQATTISDLEKQKEEINKQKQDIANKKQQEQQKYDSANQKANSIQSNVDEVEGEMEAVDEALVETIATVEMIAEEIKEKEEQIKISKAEYDEAKRIEDEQYDAMKIRIRYLYEKGDHDYLQIVLESRDFSEMLNKAEYVELLYSYDRKMLKEFQIARENTEAKKQKLEEERSELEAQQHELEEERKNLEELLKEKQAQYDNYSVQLSRAKQEAAIFKDNIKKQNDEIKKLEAAGAAKQSEIDAAKKAQEEARKAQEAALSKEGSSGSSGKSYAAASSYSGSGSKGQQIANYACQFIGNPYVPGGTSLTDGADCSGFIWRIYKDFGYSVPRTSYSFREAGTGVSYDEARPGDVFCYAGHVGLYIGNGQIVHASTQKTGIKITNATYREILAIRRFV